MSKSRIEIVDIFELGNILAVKYVFDTDETGQVNFHLDATEDQIMRTLESIYARAKKIKDPETVERRGLLMKHLKGKKIK